MGESAFEKTRRLAKESIANGEALAWFEEVYVLAAGDHEQVPWGHLKPNHNICEWCERERILGAGKSALIVGCGFGDDAEYFASLGFYVTAFDIAPTAIDWCKKRFPDSSVTYEVQDLFAAPESWQGSYDFVLESNTLQALPQDLRLQAVPILTSWLATAGTLLISTYGRESDEVFEDLPWPLSREDLSGFTELGLTEVRFEEFEGKLVDRPARRFHVEYKN